MKITVSTTDLKETLSIAQATLGKGPDITSHFVFKKTGSGVSVLTCDPPRLFSAIPLKGCTVEGNEPFSVEGKRFLQAISAVSGVLEISHVEGDVNFVSDKGKLVFSSLDTTAFPPWSEMFESSEHKTQVPAGKLSSALTSLKPYISDDEARRPELCMALFKGGRGYACDGFGLSMARDEAFNNLSLKVHFKDIPSLVKFLKSHDGHSISVHEGEKASFLKTEDGAVLGFMHLPFDMPQKITDTYAEAFDWTPRRVWRFEKSAFLTAINFLTSGASPTDLKVNFKHAEGELLSSPTLEMKPYSGKGTLSYALDLLPPSVANLAEADLSSISDPGEHMYLSRLKSDAEGTTEGDDVSEFGFNHLYMKRALDVVDGALSIGSTRENARRGYMLFKHKTDGGVEVASIVGWMV
jgi:hypothetical protein